MKNLLLLIAVTSLFLGCNNAAVNNQVNSLEAESTGEPEGPHTSVEWRIWAYSYAAPLFIAENCPVMAMDGTMLRVGTNGWTAMAANPRGMSDPENGWKDAHEAMPMVGDEIALQWGMAFMAGTFPKVDGDGWAWMLHGDMGEDNTKAGVFNKEDSTPGEWIESGPHLMLMPKDPATLENFSTDFMGGAPYVMFAGTDYAHLMIPMEDYYKYTK